MLFISNNNKLAIILRLECREFKEKKKQYNLLSEIFIKVLIVKHMLTLNTNIRIRMSHIFMKRFVFILISRRFLFLFVKKIN